jgi:hypothetical protein
VSDEQLILSRQRVKNFGEVFTPSKVVKEMCDLIQAECYDEKTTFLEPSCGTGNFLVEILSRKLSTIIADGDSDKETEEKFYMALGSIYGVDLQDDNVKQCQSRLQELAETMAYGIGLSLSKTVVSSILQSNIRCADALKDTVLFAKVSVNKTGVVLKYHAVNLQNGNSEYKFSVGVAVWHL